jgi:ABC-type multidrug transport system ATPase subunit
VIVSSHLLSEIEQIATRVLIIDKGKKLVEGNSSELLDPSQTIVELQTMDNEFAMQQIKSSKWADKLQGQRNNALVIKLDRKEIPALHTDLANMQIQLLSLQPRHSLEDYFLQVTSGNQHVDTYSN